MPQLRRALACASLSLLASRILAQEGQMDGYLGVPNARVDPAFGGGFSMYVAAWPLLAKWPGPRFQTGLFGTWMHAAVGDDKREEKLYSDIEGGLGWWRDTRFATATPKFIMGGVALNFVEWANGPGAGKGRDWNKPAGKYAIAQLSPWVLWPPDGLNLEQGTCGELFGYGYLPLPLTEPKSTTRGAPVKTGDQCWTLFLNTATFKGPVTFFTPLFFADAATKRPELEGLFLDSRPANPNRALQMETQYVPAIVGKDDAGREVARIAPTRFPVDADGTSVLVHKITSYRRDALWNAVRRWFEGGEVASGRVDDGHAIVHTIPGEGWSTWRLHTPQVPKEQRVAIDWQQFAKPVAVDPHTFGYRFDRDLTQRDAEQPLVILPQFFAQQGEGKAARWRALAKDAPAPPPALRDAKLGEPGPHRPEPYVTPSDGAWAKPGPVAGPFEAKLGDGSVVTYAWYRFADQPALQHADLSTEERERLQGRVELLHRHWLEDRDYLPPPSRGKLARLDPALLVTPPKGFEVGYVPIVTRQAAQ